MLRLLLWTDISNGSFEKQRISSHAVTAEWWMVDHQSKFSCRAHVESRRFLYKKHQIAHGQVEAVEGGKCIGNTDYLKGFKTPSYPDMVQDHC